MAGLPDEVLSTAQVKEEGQNAYQAETDTEGEDEDIDLDNLQPLLPTFASRTKFPVGCKVWYNVGNSKTQPKILRAKAAIVTEVYQYFGTTKYVYKLQSEAPTEHEIILYEHKLVYAIGCPVKIEKSSTNGAVDGIIVAPNVDKGEDGCRVVTYSVQYSGEEEGGLTIESGVAAEHIKYRGNEVEADSKSEVVQGNKLKEATEENADNAVEASQKGETLNVNKERLAVEEHENYDENQEDLSKTAEANNRGILEQAVEQKSLSPNFAVSIDRKQPDRKSLVTANRWQPPQPPVKSEQKHSSNLEAVARPSKRAKIKHEKSLASKVRYEIVVPPWVPQIKGGQKCSSLSLFGEY